MFRNVWKRWNWWYTHDITVPVHLSVFSGFWVGHIASKLAEKFYGGVYYECCCYLFCSIIKILVAIFVILGYGFQLSWIGYCKNRGKNYANIIFSVHSWDNIRFFDWLYCMVVTKIKIHVSTCHKGQMGKSKKNVNIFPS